MMRYYKYIKRYKKLINYQLLTLTYLSVSILTFILIIPNCKKGPYEEWNGAILCGKTSHPYLHVIEQTDEDLFFLLTSEIMDENIKGHLDRDNLLRIRNLLMYFEEKYIDNHACNVKLKEEYFKRPSVDQILTKTRALKNK